MSGQSAFFIIVEFLCSSCRIFDGCQVAFQVISIIRCLICCIGEGHQVIHVVVTISCYTAKGISYFGQVVILVIFQMAL